MRLRTFLATTALIAAATSTTASAQTAAPRSKSQKGLAATSRARSRFSSPRKPTTRRPLPPAPPVPYRPSQRGASSYRDDFNGMMGMDNSGRRDQSGHAVPFYSTVRGKPPVGLRASAAASSGSGGKPREIPHKSVR
jgi:hypothetical protein